MELLLKRGIPSLACTIGDLYIDGQHECFTLEDVIREPATGRPSAWAELVAWVLSWKVAGRTAIPRGCYQLTLHKSPHLGWVLMLNGVPGYDLVYIHAGNSAADTLGCILVGQTKEANLIYQSKAALSALFPKVEAALKAGQEAWITVQ